MYVPVYDANELTNKADAALFAFSHDWIFKISLSTSSTTI